MSEELELLKEEVNALYDFRDNFFNNYGAEKAHTKNEEVADRMHQVINKINEIKDVIPDDSKGEYYFLKGRALNVAYKYSKEAEELLGRATKFNFPPAWNELGECLYKKADLKGAQTCFQKALNLEKKAVYFRNMSMLMRSMSANDLKEREENIQKGLEFAREALKLDFSDGHSWLVLGNSYLTLFFTFGAKHDVLKNCKSAYTKAEEDSKASQLPELHFSKFQIEWYGEDYKSALRSLKRATELEPIWTEPKIKLEESIKFLSRLSHLVHTKGQLSQKKIANFISGIKMSHLGPYEVGGTSLTGGVKPLLSSFSLLAEGNNEKKIVLGCVVCTAVPDSGLPFAFCLADNDGVCRAVTVYNWAGNCGVKIGDYVAIVAPILKRHNLEQEGIKEFFSLRVVLPVMLVVNKRCVASSQVISSNVVSYQKPE